jgi:hypothetical protein
VLVICTGCYNDAFTGKIPVSSLYLFGFAFEFYSNYLAANGATEVVDAVINETGELESVTEVESTNTVEE